MTSFNPVADSGVTLNAATSSSRVKLGGQPLEGDFEVRVYNVGPQALRLKFGDDTVTATGDDIPVPPSAVEVFKITNPEGAGDWYAAAAANYGTTTVEFTTGALEAQAVAPDYPLGVVAAELEAVFDILDTIGPSAGALLTLPDDAAEVPVTISGDEALFATSGTISADRVQFAGYDAVARGTSAVTLTEPRLSNSGGRVLEVRDTAALILEDGAVDCEGATNVHAGACTAYAGTQLTVARTAFQDAPMMYVNVIGGFEAEDCYFGAYGLDPYASDSHFEAIFVNSGEGAITRCRFEPTGAPPSMGGHTSVIYFEDYVGHIDYALSEVVIGWEGSPGIPYTLQVAARYGRTVVVRISNAVLKAGTSGYVGVTELDGFVYIIDGGDNFDYDTGEPIDLTHGTLPGVPVNDDPPVIEEAAAGEDLTAEAASWTNHPTLIQRRWQRSDNGSTGWTNTGGTGLVQETHAVTDVGKYFRLGETARNVSGDSAEVFSNVVGPLEVSSGGGEPTIYLDPTFKGGDQTLSDGNMTITSSANGGRQLCLSNLPVGPLSGVKLYMEVLINSFSEGGAFGVTRNTRSPNAPLGTNLGGADESVAIQNNGEIWRSGTPITDTGGDLADGEHIGILLDLTSSPPYFYTLRGAGSGTLSTGVHMASLITTAAEEPYFAVGIEHNTGPVSLTFNGGKSAFHYPLPSGYAPVDP